jgi:hypothetical protein
MRIQSQLLMLTILALIQPFLSFYLLRDNLLLCILYGFLGLIFTLNCIVKSYLNWRVNGLFYFIWSLLIPLISVLSLSSEAKMSRIDAFIFMTKRESIVNKIKNSNELVEQLDYTDNGFLPISIKNNVDIKGSKNELNIYFKTVEDGWFGIHEEGVMYSDKPEKIETYEKVREGRAGVVDEYSFRIKKIKPHWYLYEYEAHNIRD